MKTYNESDVVLVKKGHPKYPNGEILVVLKQKGSECLVCRAADLEETDYDFDTLSQNNYSNWVNCKDFSDLHLEKKLSNYLTPVNIFASISILLNLTGLVFWLVNTLKIV